MGKIPGYRVAIVVALMAGMSVLVFRQPPGHAHGKAVQLGRALQGLGAWNAVQDISLDPAIVGALRLDDYVFREYSNGQQTLGLYIGYYLSSESVGAAHDPLVCFPGQGWELSDKNAGTLEIDSRKGEAISYAAMLARRGGERVLVIYWFQSHDRSAANAFMQKVQTFSNRIRSKPDDNAFIRITVPMAARTRAECLGIGLDFMRAFYPRFLAAI